jgi:hypothetical protein
MPPKLKKSPSQLEQLQSSSPPKRPKLEDGDNVGRATLLNKKEIAPIASRHIPEVGVICSPVADVCRIYVPM